MSKSIVANVQEAKPLHEVEHEVDAVKDRIKSLEEKARSLTQQRDEAIKRGDHVAAINARRELKPIAEGLEELQVERGAAESRLRICQEKENVLKAAAIRKRIVTDLWPRGLKAYGTLQQFFDKLPSLLEEVNTADGLIQQLTKEHFQLTGERIQVDRFGLPPDLIRTLGQLHILPLPPAERFHLTDPRLQAKEVK